MIKDQILIGNTTIANFMKAIPISTYDDHTLLDFIKKENFPDNYSRYHASTTLKYHTDWNWIMLVVNKIHNLSEGKWFVHIQDNWVRIEDGNEGQGLWDFRINEYNCDCIQDKNLTSIEALWLCIVEFVKWYNLTYNKI